MLKKRYNFEDILKERTDEIDQLKDHFETLAVQVGKENRN